jgi:hypothetical protein
MITDMQKTGKVAISWGGIVKVVSEQGTGGSSGVSFHMPGASFGPGATFIGAIIVMKPTAEKLMADSTIGPILKPGFDKLVDKFKSLGG